MLNGTLCGAQNSKKVGNVRIVDINGRKNPITELREDQVVVNV